MNAREIFLSFKYFQDNLWSTACSHCRLTIWNVNKLLDWQETFLCILLNVTSIFYDLLSHNTIGLRVNVELKMYKTCQLKLKTMVGLKMALVHFFLNVTAILVNDQNQDCLNFYLMFSIKYHQSEHSNTVIIRINNTLYNRG